MVGHRQAVVRLLPSRAMSAPVRCVACTAVVGRAEQALGGEQPGRGEPVGGEARGVLGGLLGEVDVQRAAARRLVHDGQRRTRYRPHRVRRHADPQPRSVAQRRDPLRPRAGGAVGEPALHAVDRAAVHVRGEVAGVEQGEPDPGLGGGLRQGVAHRVRVGVRAPVRAVVQVVELAHRRDAGQRALGESGAGQGEVGVGVEPGGDGVHALAPGPERACPTPRRRGCARAAPGERRGSGRRRSRAARRPAAGCASPGAVPGSTPVNRPPSTVNVTSRVRPPGSSACAAQNLTGGTAAAAGQVGRDVGQRGHPRQAVGPLGVLGGRVGHARRVADEQHRRGHPGRREDPGVVPGARRQPRRVTEQGRRAGPPAPCRTPSGPSTTPR